MAYGNKEWGEIWFLSSDFYHSVWIRKGSKHHIKMKTLSFENGILWVSEDLLPLTAGGSSEEAFFGTLSHGMEFTGTHALDRERLTAVFRKCWGMMECRIQVASVELIPKGTVSQCSGKMEGHTESKILSIFLQTNFRCFLLWLDCNLVIFSTHFLLHRMIFYAFCKGWHVIEQGQHRGVVIYCSIYILLDSNHYFYSSSLSNEPFL